MADPKKAAKNDVTESLLRASKLSHESKGTSDQIQKPDPKSSAPEPAPKSWHYPRRERNVSVDLNPGQKVALARLADISCLTIAEYLRGMIAIAWEKQIILKVVFEVADSSDPSQIGISSR